MNKNNFSIDSIKPAKNPVQKPVQPVDFVVSEAPSESEPKQKKQSIWTREFISEKPAVPKAAKEPKVKKPFFEKKVKEENSTKEKKGLKPHHKLIVSLVFAFITITILSLTLAGGVYAHENMFKNKVFPGVVVWGEPVGGKTMDEVSEIITEKIKNYKVTVTGPDQNYQATADDLGIVFNSEGMALSAYSKGRTSSSVDNYLTRARLLIAQVNWKPLQNAVRSSDLALTPSYTVDEIRLGQYVDKVSNNIKINPQDSAVSVQGSKVTLVPAVYGREVEKDQLKKDLLGSIKGLKSENITVKTTEVTPKVIDKAADEVRVQTENVIARPVILTYKGQEYRPNQETVASWISYTKQNGAASYTLVVDPSKMNNYFNFLGSKINIYSIPKKVRVENGVKQTVTQEGKDGMLVDTNVLGQKIASMLPVQPSVNLEIPTYVSSYKTQYEQVVVANWEKYIDINLSTQTMTAYLKGGTVVGSWKVTTGNRYHPTPVGTWLVVGKSAVTRMSGGTPGIDYYDLPNVHWVTWFKGGGYSIHEAYWRSAFGGQDYLWNGSHGCVNSPLEVAHFIFDWAPVGTPVMVH